jgi:phosphopantetheine--protein transferase-like protein
MIAGIGVDLFETRRFSKFRNDPEFLKQIFSASEIKCMAGTPRPAYPPSVLFAIKEATRKALGKTIKPGWFWRHIRVGPGLDIRLTKNIKTLTLRKNFKMIRAAVSRSRKFAFALTVIEK